MRAGADACHIFGRLEGQACVSCRPDHPSIWRVWQLRIGPKLVLPRDPFLHLFVSPLSLTNHCRTILSRTQVSSGNTAGRKHGRRGQWKLYRPITGGKELLPCLMIDLRVNAHAHPRAPPFEKQPSRGRESGGLRGDQTLTLLSLLSHSSTRQHTNLTRNMTNSWNLEAEN